MSSKSGPKAKLYTQYPLSSILLYNGSTVAHYVLGGIGIMIGYNFLSWAGSLFGVVYLVFSFVEMYIIMPSTVCPHCVYYKLENALCISGLNVMSKRIAKEGDVENFVKRAEGLLCFNNVYIAILIIPLMAIIPVLFINYSLLLLLIFLALTTLLVFRFFIIFPQIACLHCRAKFQCPQAGQMGVRER